MVRPGAFHGMRFSRGGVRRIAVVDSTFQWRRRRAWRHGISHSRIGRGGIAEFRVAHREHLPLNGKSARSPALPQNPKPLTMQPIKFARNLYNSRRVSENMKLFSSVVCASLLAGCAYAQSSDSNFDFSVRHRHRRRILARVVRRPASFLWGLLTTRENQLTSPFTGSKWNMRPSR